MCVCVPLRFSMSCSLSSHVFARYAELGVERLEAHVSWIQMIMSRCLARYSEAIQWSWIVMDSHGISNSDPSSYSPSSIGS